MKTAQPKQPHSLPPTAIRKLLNKYAISLQTLQDCMEKDVEVGKTTLHRMVTGTLSEELSAELRPIAAKCLRRFLYERGLATSEVDAELTAIFNGGEYQPMSFQRIRLTRAEREYFGLPTGFDIFADEPEAKAEVHFPVEYREIFDTIIDAAKYRHFLAVLGPVGSSKSTIQNLIRDHIETETNLRIVWPEFYNQRNLTPLEIARSILRALGVERIPQRATDIANAVTNHLRALTLEGNRVAILVDNCHELPKESIRSFKKFLEMSAGGFQRYLGIVLLGWPEFENKLKDPDFAEIYERLQIVPMPPFKRAANGTLTCDREISTKLMTGYIEHRFASRDLNVLDYFDQEAIDYIAANAETPLQCGNIANRALQISKDKFDNKQVIGEALRTSMLFDTPATGTPAFRKR